MAGGNYANFFREKSAIGTGCFAFCRGMRGLTGKARSMEGRSRKGKSKGKSNSKGKSKGKGDGTQELLQRKAKQVLSLRVAQGQDDKFGCV
jgi:hypothetical protein